MNRFLTAALLAAAALVQLTWAPRFEIAGAFPNLVLILAVGVTWTYGVQAGFACACAGGLLLDMGAAGPLGPRAAALLVAVYGVGFWLRNLPGVSASRSAVSAGVASLLYSGALAVTAGLLREPVPAPAVFVQLALVGSLYNALLAPAVVAAVQKLAAVGRSGSADTA